MKESGFMTVAGARARLPLSPREIDSDEFVDVLLRQTRLSGQRHLNGDCDPVIDKTVDLKTTLLSGIPALTTNASDRGQGGPLGQSVDLATFPRKIAQSPPRHSADELAPIL